MVTAGDITEKRDILYALTPFTDGLKAFKQRLDLIDFAWQDLHLYGSVLTKDGVQSVLEGHTVPGVPVFEHRLCEAHRKLLSRFDDRIHMDLDVDAIMLNGFCTILSGTEFPPFRDGAPLLYHLDFVPGDDDRISADLAEMFAAVHRAERAGHLPDFCAKAAAIHMGIIKVYPYAEGFSELAARAAMQYELVRAGYFPVDADIPEYEYNKISAAAVKSGDPEPFANLLRVSIFKKLHVLIDAAERGV